MGDYEIEEVWHGGCRVRRRHHERSLRPGGTVSGPIMMALADFAMYVAVLSAIGWVPLAVTTNLTINFLKKPGARDLLAEARLIKLGKRLAVGEVAIRSDGDDDWSPTSPRPIRFRSAEIRGNKIPSKPTD